MVILSILGITMLLVLWWIIKSYLGNMAANCITLIVISLIIFALNSIASEPSNQEVEIFKEKRKGVGY